MGNRMIKESIRTSRSVGGMTDFQFRTWVYLITYVDDYGRGSADPEILKGLVFTRRRGVTEATIEKALADLANMGMIHLYEVDGEPFFCFPSWGEHQRVQQKRSKFPAPEEATGDMGESAAAHAGSRKVTVTYGDPPPEVETETELQSETKRKARAGASSVFRAFSGGDRELLQALLDFDEMRRKSRKPMTDKARELVLKDLTRLSRDRAIQIAILNQSVKRGWLGVFPLKADPDRPSGGASLDLAAFEQSIDAKGLTGGAGSE